jgi:hypothetical protein
MCGRRGSGRMDTRVKPRMTTTGQEHRPASSRDAVAPESCGRHSRPRKKRAQGMPGARLAPAASHAKGNEHTSKSPRSHRGHPAFPARMVLTAYSELSPAIGLFCHRRLADCYPQSLMPASRHQDHTASPSAINAFVLCVTRVRRIPRPTCRDDRETPLFIGTGSRCSIAVSTK